MKGYIFDFDETLANSNILIGISRIFNGSSLDPLEWLQAIGIDPNSACCFKRLSNHNIVYLDSLVFEEYLDKTRDQFELGELQRSEPGLEKLHGLEDVIDYSLISKVDNPKPIEPIIEIGRRAFANGHIVGVVTARSSKEFLQSLEGFSVKVKCKEDIQSFLAQNGLPVQLEDIHCVGDLPGTVPSNKARAVLREFIEKYDLNTVDFFDDSEANLLAVESLDNGSVRIDTHDSKKICSSSDFNWRLGSSIRRRSWRFEAMRSRKLSGLEEI